MRVVSRRGVNFGFWSHFVCFRQNAIICSHEGLVLGCMRRNRNIYKIWSLLGVKMGWATPGLVSFRGLIQNFRRASPLLHVQSPPVGTKNKHGIATKYKLFFSAGDL